MKKYFAVPSLLSDSSTTVKNYINMDYCQSLELSASDSDFVSVEEIYLKFVPELSLL